MLKHKTYPIILTCILLCACSTIYVPKNNNIDVKNLASSILQKDGHAPNTVENLITLEELKQEYYLVKSFNVDNPTSRSATSLLLLQASLAIQIGETMAAHNILNTLGSSDYIHNIEENFILFNRLYADLEDHQKSFLASASRLIEIHPLIPEEYILHNIKLIFTRLAKLSLYNLNKIIDTEHRYIAWFELAAINLDYKYQLNLRDKHIQKWQTKWPDHLLNNFLHQIIYMPSIDNPIINNPQITASSGVQSYNTYNLAVKSKELLLESSTQDNQHTNTELVNNNFNDYRTDTYNTAAPQDNINLLEQSDYINSTPQSNNPYFISHTNKQDYDVTQHQLSNNPYSEKHIVFLLPLSANRQLQNFSKAITLGFMEYYYNYSSAFKVSFIDTQKYQDDILQAVTVAENIGATLIIGPLQKQHIHSLQNSPIKLSTPLLTLNYGDLNHSFQPMLQFGLLPEHEVEAVAVNAWLAGKKKATIISSDSPWGSRISHEFQAIWDKLGGQIVYKTFINKQSNYKKIANTITGISIADVRKFKEDSRYLPQPTYNSDFVFLATSAQQSRQIKANLDFYLAADMPLYAISNIYIDSTNNSHIHDIENITFPSMPWFFASHDSTRTKLHKQWKKNDLKTQAFTALGMDVFLLSIHIKEIVENKTTNTIFGATGELSIRKAGVIYRQPLWSKVEQGKLIALTTPTHSKANIYTYNNRSK